MAAAIIQQIGINAKPEKAFATNTAVATSQISQLVSDGLPEFQGLYALAWTRPTEGIEVEYFEGYVRLIETNSEVPQPSTFTVYPWSQGLLGTTQCSLGASNNLENLLAYRVLTKTYRYLSTDFNHFWAWETVENRERFAKEPPSSPVPRLVGQVPFSGLTLCPPSEYP